MKNAEITRGYRIAAAVFKANAVHANARVVIRELNRKRELKTKAPMTLAISWQHSQPLSVNQMSKYAARACKGKNNVAKVAKSSNISSVTTEPVFLNHVFFNTFRRHQEDLLLLCRQLLSLYRSIKVQTEEWLFY